MPPEQIEALTAIACDGTSAAEGLMLLDTIRAYHFGPAFLVEATTPPHPYPRVRALTRARASKRGRASTGVASRLN